MINYWWSCSIPKITIKPVITQTNNITIMSIRGVSAIPDSQTEKEKILECPNVEHQTRESRDWYSGGRLIDIVIFVIFLVALFDGHVIFHNCYSATPRVTSWVSDPSAIGSTRAPRGTVPPRSSPPGAVWSCAVGCNPYVAPITMVLTGWWCNVPILKNMSKSF